MMPLSNLWNKAKEYPVFLVLMINSLEFMDLRLYTHFGWLIKKIFFSEWSETFLEAFRLSNIYLLAPISCLIWAYVGDFKGRHIVIVSSALMMGLSSLCIVFLPVESYPIDCAYALIALRIIQGLALGGEPMAAYLYLMETGQHIRYLTFLNCVVALTEGIGGIIALLIGSGVLYFFGFEHWRYIFFIISLFIGIVTLGRAYLSNTKEYNEYLSNQKITLRDYAKINELFKFRNRNIRFGNYISAFCIWLAYPSMFMTCYLHVSPYICTKMGWAEQGLIWYNLFVTVGEYAISIPLFWYITRYTSWNLKRVGFISIIVGLIITSYVFLNVDSLSIVWIFVGQISLMSLVNYCWITPDIFKTFSVIGRYTTMARSWCLARLINFPICVFLLQVVIDRYGLGKGSLGVLLIINLIAMSAFYFMQPYSNFYGDVRDDETLL